jgi:hypothetical protein
MRPAFSAAATLLVGLGLVVPARGEKRVDVNAELRLLDLGQTPPRHIPGATFRVAVFTYEDPDGTGLGDEAAALLARAILTSSGVSSLGVLRYEGDLSPQRPGDLGYFDKVERVVANQGVSLAVWGRIARSRGGLLVDTYAQVPADAHGSRFTWRLRLPKGMGGEQLLARLRPNRFAVQRLQLPLEAGDAIRSAARRLDELRGTPADAAAIVGRLPKEQVYSLLRRQGEWVSLQVKGGPGGWARLPACPAECGGFLSAATFAGGLIGYMESGSAPPELPGLTSEALAVRDQLLALDALNDPQLIVHSLDLAKRWSSRVQTASDGSIGKGAPSPPGGAAAANAAAMARVSRLLMDGFGAVYEQTRPELDSLRQAVREGRLKPPVGVPAGAEAFREMGPRSLSPLDVGLIYDRITLDRQSLRAIAFELVDAAFLDPRNPELLHNIAVLFRSSGDAERAAKAERLEESAGPVMSP